MSSRDPRDDAQLLAAHAAGDRDAFTELVRRHRDRLWSLALGTLRDPEEAADAVQEALLSAYRAAGSFRGEAAVTTWLHRIVVNACLDQIRRRRSRPTVALAEQGPDEPVEPRDRVAERETALVVHAALDRLGVHQRAAITLVDLEGFSVAEAAAILSVPVGTVKSRCARGRLQLAELLGQLRSDSGGGVGSDTGGGASSDRNLGRRFIVQAGSGPDRGSEQVR